MQGESLFEIKCLFVDIIENERGVKKNLIWKTIIVYFGYKGTKTKQYE